MIWLLYYFLIYVMVLSIRISTLWSPKSKDWISGRKNWDDQIKLIPQKKGTRIWFHVASLGEFEQARPVIEKLKKHNGQLEIILTFFSPSGFLIRSSYPLATVLYLPADLPGNALKWISSIRPDMAVFVKYDLWPGYLKALQAQDIPCMLISAHWTPGGLFNSRNIPPTKSLLQKFKRIFLQKDDHLDYFRQRGFSNLSVAGDTRIDRSLELPAETKSRIPAELAAIGPFDLVAGSTWAADEKLITEAIHQLNLKALIAPHDVSEENIARILKSFDTSAIRLTKLKETTANPRVVIVDNIGLLSLLYSLGRIAYVGGGFGAGIHNTLEPMAHGKPVLFGPSYWKFPESVEMVRLKAARPVTDIHGLVQAIRDFQQMGIAEKAGKTAIQYLSKNAGASIKVANYILESIPYSGKE